MIEVHGQGGQIQFDGQYITITRKGFLARTTIGKGEKRLHIVQIAAIQWKPAGPLVNGFIQFTLPGGNERRSAFGAQTTSAARDENSVIFTRKQQPEFEKLRTAIDQAIAAQHAAPGQGLPTTVEGLQTVTDELVKLGELHEKGLITTEEFNQQKNRILGG